MHRQITRLGATVAYAAVAFGVFGPGLLAQETAKPVAGTIAADQRIQTLILSPRTPDGRQAGPPLFIDVDDKGAFSDSRIEKSRNYFVGTNPPCVKISALTVTGENGLELALASDPALKDSSNPGVVTKRLALAVSAGFSSGMSASATFEPQGGGLRLSGGGPSGSISVGGIRMISSICPEAGSKDDATVVRVSGVGGGQR